MTAEDVKAAVREYADAEFPAGWTCASVMVRPVGVGDAQTLLVLPTPPRPSSEQSSDSPSRRTAPSAAR